MQFVLAALAIIALVVVHEFGHLIVAKLSGMRVDEFGIGYPPKALTLGHIGETEYTLNWLPLGGFVRIRGENGEEKDDPRSFGARPRILQALVLVAGIAMNLLVAYILITGALIAGTPRALGDDEIARATHVELAVADVLPYSPAAAAGILAGDSIISATDAIGSWKATDPTSFSTFVAASKGSPISLVVKHDEKIQTVVATPAAGVAASDPSRYALGVEVATIGVVPLSFIDAIVQGASLTWGVITISAAGLLHFFYSLFTFSANLSQVAGPIGITVVVGAASSTGLGNVLSIIAIISVSLALINLLPIPALDGGRLLIVIIESIIRRPVAAKLANGINMVAFALLIPLMLIVSGHDVWKLFQ